MPRTRGLGSGGALLSRQAGQRRMAAALQRRVRQQWARAEHFARMAMMFEARAARLASRPKATAITVRPK
jgi:hypothetical protein